LEKPKVKHCIVSESVYELIKTFVIETSGTFHKGSIKETVEAAAKSYIRLRRKERQNTNTQTQGVNKITNDTSTISNTILRNKDKVVAYLENGEYKNCDLLKKYEQVRTVVSLEHLKKAISFTIGSDDRTVKKWLLIFRQSRIIREVGTAIFEFAPLLEDLEQDRQKPASGRSDYLENSQEELESEEERPNQTEEEAIKRLKQIEQEADDIFSGYDVSTS
jgi:hypothetical protein